MKNCLVVEDSRVMRAVARRLFEELRFETGEAEDGMGGLRACHEKMPDVIFLDGNLPSMPGPEFIKSVRGQQNGAHPVILLATTENDPDEIAAAMAAGADDFVMKPYDRATLRSKLVELGQPV
ncbi:MAG: response regulator [Alphaproteobacteria bacterium]|jgi:two-component system chemotaxis response regulator CheY|nr:response regulator [Alphaproteobacteria bacterium]